MLFSSLEFVAFLLAVYTLYWLLQGSRRWQNNPVWLVRYIFYAWWDWRLLNAPASLLELKREDTKSKK